MTRLAPYRTPLPSGGRSPRYSVFVIGVCETPEVLERGRGWVRGFYNALSPCAVPHSTYVNALSDGVDDNRVREAYGAQKYDRLIQIKQKYDPDNLFRRNANLNPAVRPPAQREAEPAAPTPAVAQP